MFLSSVELFTLTTLTCVEGFTLKTTLIVWRSFKWFMVKVCGWLPCASGFCCEQFSIWELAYNLDKSTLKLKFCIVVENSV